MLLFRLSLSHCIQFTHARGSKGGEARREEGLSGSERQWRRKGGDGEEKKTRGERGRGKGAAIESYRGVRAGIEEWLSPFPTFLLPDSIAQSGRIFHPDSPINYLGNLP